jgi:hypothetical protein
VTANIKWTLEFDERELMQKKVIQGMVKEKE